MEVRENEASQAEEKKSNHGFSYLSQAAQYYEKYIFKEDQASDCCVNCTESNIYTKSQEHLDVSQVFSAVLVHVLYAHHH